MKRMFAVQSETNVATRSKIFRSGRPHWFVHVTTPVLVALGICVLPVRADSGTVGGKKEFRIYQANAYVGGLIEAPLALDPADKNYQMELLQSVTEVYSEIVASDPPTRMARLAQEIASELPDVATLEELYTIEQAPATDQGPGEFTVLYDYLQLLVQSLSANGAHYEVAVVSTEADVALPMFLNLQTFEVAWGRIIDHEAILVRSDLPPGYLRVSNPQTGRFSVFPQVSLGDLTISIYHGWCSVDVFTRGEQFRLVCPHPQDESVPQIQEAEVLELLAGLADVRMPVIIAGDLNSDPLGRNGTISYPFFGAAGFADTWATLHPTDLGGGLTWGHDSSLADPAQKLIWRLDYIFYRGSQFTPISLDILDPVLGLTPPLWPSDHAAITATFSLRKGKTQKLGPSTPHN